MRLSVCCVVCTHLVEFHVNFCLTFEVLFLYFLDSFFGVFEESVEDPHLFHSFMFHVHVESVEVFDIFGFSIWFVSLSHVSFEPVWEILMEVGD